MQEIFQRQELYWSNKAFLRSTLLAWIFFFSCMVIHFAAGTYATQLVGAAVPDLILSRLPVMDVSIIFIEGNILFWGVIICLLVNQPKRIPFVIKALALFMLVRAFFVILTHLGPDPNQILLRHNDLLDKFTVGGDYFFSGHTGAPFLMALTFWNHKYLRICFLLASVLFAVTVLLGHLHYSIDVFAAYFITFGIYHIARYLFDDDYHLMLHGLKS